jgi:hypothetical protein
VVFPSRLFFFFSLPFHSCGPPSTVLPLCGSFVVPSYKNSRYVVKNAVLSFLHVFPAFHRFVIPPFHHFIDACLQHTCAASAHSPFLSFLTRPRTKRNQQTKQARTLACSKNSGN